VLSAFLDVSSLSLAVSQAPPFFCPAHDLAIACGVFRLGQALAPSQQQRRATATLWESPCLIPRAADSDEDRAGRAFARGEGNEKSDGLVCRYGLGLIAATNKVWAARHLT
jgi:hypothetical protein